MFTELKWALLCASGRVTAPCWIQLKNMLDETCQKKYIRSDSCYTTGRKAQRSGPGREIRGGCSRQKNRMMTELCVPLAHQLSPCIMKQKQIKVKRSPQDLLASTMTSERRRESHKVELRAWLWLSQRKGYMELKHAQYGHIWLRKHCLIAGITT